MNPLPNAETIKTYWKTSSSSPDKWLEKAGKEIQKAGGAVIQEGYASEHGRAAYLMTFTLDGDTFKVIWPVLHTDTGTQLDVKRQAATFLYYDIKNRCLAARVLGARRAFFADLVLPDGRTAAQASNDELLYQVPVMLGGKIEPLVIQLGAGEKGAGDGD